MKKLENLKSFYEQMKKFKCFSYLFKNHIFLALWIYKKNIKSKRCKFCEKTIKFAERKSEKRDFVSKFDLGARFFFIPSVEFLSLPETAYKLLRITPAASCCAR